MPLRSPVEIVDGAVVYKARDSIEARALAAYLDNAEIPAHVAGEVMANVFGVQNIGGVSGSEVWVSRSNRGPAEELIQSWQKEYGGAGPAKQDEAEPFRYPLKAFFAVMAIVAVISATSRLFGTTFSSFVAATTIWFWILLIAASIWAVYFRKVDAVSGEFDAARREENSRNNP
jgi:hypothetical protein